MQNAGLYQDQVVHVADIHFWRVVLNPLRLMNKRFLGNLTVLLKRRYEFPTENAEPFADAVAATGVKTVIMTGDFTSTSLDGEFELAVRFVRGMRDRGLTVHVLAGNHDVYTFEAWRAARFEQYFAEFLPEGGYPSLQHLPGGTSLILVPTVCPRHLSTRGLVTAETIEEVSDLLTKCGPRVIVAAHYPVLHHTHGYTSSRWRRLENAKALRTALAASGRRILYLCGHVHRFSYERDRDNPNIEHLSSDGFFRRAARTGVDGEFVEIGVTGEGFRVRRHMHRQTWGVLEESPR